MTHMQPQITQRELAALLLEAGQAHLFEGWEAAGTNDDKKHAFFAQIAKLHATYPYPGGLKAYLGGCGQDSQFGRLLLDRRSNQTHRAHSRTPHTQINTKKNNAERARCLLAESAQGVNPLEGWSPAVPQGEVLQPGTPRYLEMEALGEAELEGACVCVTGAHLPSFLPSFGC